MDAILLTLFGNELRTQCEQVEVAREQLGIAMQEKDVDAVWAALQNILVTAGNVSKLLWGSRANDEKLASRKPLRDLAGVGDDSPLRPRSVRNAFEHIDERIEDWFRETDKMVYSSRCVGVSMAGSMVDDGEPVEVQHFGFFDPKTGILKFWNDAVSIPDLLTAMDGILARLREHEHFRF
jgi:hypothetical protein